MHQPRFAITGAVPPPMPERDPGWGIYDIFEASDGEGVFVAVVTDSQWHAFCESFDLAELGASEALATNLHRVDARDWLIPELAAVLGRRTRAEICERCEAAGVGFAPIRRPDELFDDPHLSRREARVDLTLEDGTAMWLPGIPLELDGRRLQGDRNPPRLGEHTIEVAGQMGYGRGDIEALVADGALGVAVGRAAESEDSRGRGPAVQVLRPAGGAIAEREVDCT